MNITPVILCGGFGSRLWPSSRLTYPKPCLTLTENDLSLLQQTLVRIAHLNLNAPIIVCNQIHRFVIAQQLESLKSTHAYLTNTRILLEPEARNTAPAITLAALESLQETPEETLLVLPADHSILWDESYDQSIVKAHQLAQQNKLVTFGIKPTQAETGYGYIKAGLDNNVLAFIEKPSLAKANEYIQKDDYLWNSGMFAFKANTFLNELKTYEKRIYQACASAFNERKQDDDFIRIGSQAFKSCPSNSIDYALMEQTKVAKVVPFYCDWQDLGNWSAVYDQTAKDKKANCLIGDIISHDTKSCLVKSESRLVATLGIENLVIIETADAVLVMNKDKSQDMSKLITQLKQTNRSEYLIKQATAKD
ncbi:bifunctional protein [Marinomonas sp. MED121]|uniref:mannose-1-phosphate guanylyltransferase/mannose-6-phosphate isomerase n=1 Tax=Marinomonas sp. MED121 TaxID=314277 RepID=UPI0000690BAD|nr:mannose-1-phosphate guanylyltransferase/mannose-6-phosphate isomerase [Marinomonas sp. MED121]EAQ66029.1 bifunctional protein [Marinomonas sp. MED121]